MKIATTFHPSESSDRKNQPESAGTCGDTPDRTSYHRENGFERENDDLQRRVQNYLNDRNLNSFDSLNVDADRGQLTISGVLNSYYDKQVAINSCRRVAGVLSVIDEIIVASHQRGGRGLD